MLSKNFKSDEEIQLPVIVQPAKVNLKIESNKNMIVEGRQSMLRVSETSHKRANSVSTYSKVNGDEFPMI